MASAAVQAAVALRSYRVATSFSHAERKRSASSFVEFQPKLTRMAPSASAGGTPMASRTCERRTLPEEQAEPDETATPSRSNRISAVSARMPGIAKARVFGSRGAFAAEHHRVDWIGGKTGLDCENKGLGTGGKAVAIAPGKLGRDAEADDPGDVLGAGPVAALLPAAADEAVADLDPRPRP